MLPQEEQKLAILFDQRVKALKRQGMSERTIGAYSRVVFRLGRFFDKCPDELEKKDLKKYFDHLIDTRSWSTVRADRCAMQFFWKTHRNPEMLFPNQRGSASTIKFDPFPSPQFCNPSG